MAYYPEYVSAGERQSKARQALEKLRKQGQEVEPVVIEGRLIARSFWGKAWCQHLESFSDYSNRLPRGRTYARNGSVLHLQVTAGLVTAIVSGTKTYHVSITITPLEAALWESLKRQSSGQIGSMLELLKGKLTDHVMRAVTDRRQGLFPQPYEIQLRCSCPDGARMCKHIAASLYGVGHRLDSRPELLFTLRGVDPMELLAVAPPATESSAHVLEGARLGEIFGIDLDDEAGEVAIYNPFEG